MYVVNLLKKTSKLLTENLIARNDYLERYSDYQNILINNKNQLIDQLTDNLLDEA